MIGGEQNGLPEGWCEIPLGNLVQPSKQKVEPSERPDASYLSLEHIESGTGTILGRGIGADVASTKAVFTAGDVLYGKLRPYLNKVCIPDFDGICSTDILVFEQSPLVVSSLLKHFLSKPENVAYANHHSSGVQLPRVSFKALAELIFPLPPLAEQRRIVDKVETLLARVQAARQRLARLPLILKRFRQAILTAACNGQLTAAWREENPDPNPTIPSERNITELDVPDSWQRAILEDVCERVSVGHVGPTSKFYCSAESGVPFIRSQNVRPGRLDLAGMEYITPEFHQSLKKSQLQSGDLLIVRVGANRADACIVPEGMGDLNCANIVFARPKFRLSRFLELYFRGPGRDRLLDETTGSAQGVVNTGAVAKIPTPIPPLTEQHEIVRRVDALFKLADAIERRVAAATARTDKLTQAILAKAFRGELVPTEAELARTEGREYETAEQLLARINAASAKASENGSPEKTRKRRKRAIR